MPVKLSWKMTVFHADRPSGIGSPICKKSGYPAEINHIAAIPLDYRLSTERMFRRRREEADTVRSIQTLGLTCIAAFGCGAAADDAFRQGHGPTAVHVNVDRSVAALWQQARGHSLRGDRLRHLNRSLCLEQYGCSTSAVAVHEPEAPERDYIDALSLGDYGPMDFKFTGDRLKVKVRF